MSARQRPRPRGCRIQCQVERRRCHHSLAVEGEDLDEARSARIDPQRLGHLHGAPHNGSSQRLELFGLGPEFALDRVWRLGFALGYEHSNLESDTNAKSDGDRFDGGVVVKYNPGALLLAAGISGGFGTYDFDRPINFPGFSALAKGNSDIGMIDARLRAAYLLTGGAWYAKPLIDFDATWLMLDSTVEQGAGGASLNVGGNNQTVLSVSPALEVGTQIRWTDGTLLRPYLRGGATFFGNNDFSLLVSFEGAPAGVGPFRIATKTDDAVADVGAGLDLIGRGGTELKLFYEGRIGDLVSEQSGGLKASVPF
jgi:uncharacterized protein with beta-barrel porin domain